MNGAGSARTERRRIACELAAMLLLALFLAAIGPFGMIVEPAGQRTIEWLLFALGGYLCFRPVIAGGNALAAASGLPPPVTIAIACLLAALPTTLLVCATIVGWQLPRVSIGTLLALYPKVLMIGGGATTLLYLLAQRARGPATASAPAPADAPPEPPSPSPPQAPVAPPVTPGSAFLDRLPPAIGRELLCVENEDHYVRAHTPLGSGLLLMRLRDAVAELEDVDGLRVHRGWWVARVAVAEVVRRDRATALRLTNGLEVPVARNEVAALRAAGWL